MSAAELVMLKSLHSQRYWGLMIWSISDVHFRMSWPVSQTLLILWLDLHRSSQNNYLRILHLCLARCTRWNVSCSVESPERSKSDSLIFNIFFNFSFASFFPVMDRNHNFHSLQQLESVWSFSHNSVPFFSSNNGSWPLARNLLNILLPEKQKKL